MATLLRGLVAASLLLLLAASPLYAQQPSDSAATDALAQIEALQTSLDSLTRQVRRLQAQITEGPSAARLATIERQLQRTARLTRRLAAEAHTGELRDDEAAEIAAIREDLDEALQEMHETLREAREEMREALRDEDGAWQPLPEAEPDENDASPEAHAQTDDFWPPRVLRHRARFGTFVGDFSYRWPLRETALYRPLSPVRYNRVEGLVLGFGLRPLEWDEYRRSKLVGQISYAFSLDAIRYDVGAETRLHDGDYAAKLGALYRRNTATNDLWKSSWAENSLAAFFFKNDFFDYYGVEGLTIYAVQRLTPYAQLSAGFRAEKHRSLDRNTNWALFGGDDFGLNPEIAKGRMQSVVLALEGGRVADLRYLPRGAAFRLEAELGDGFGGDFAFNRYLGDGRLYLPVTPFSSLSLRLRGGAATGDVPPQKLFTLGGVGSVRGYPQNGFGGTRMLLANAEYAVGELDLLPDLLDDVLLFGFADAGWTNATGDAFAFDDVYPSVGFGLGLDDRALRLELAFPLREVYDGSRDPALWLRINPAF